MLKHCGVCEYWVCLHSDQDEDLSDESDGYCNAPLPQWVYQEYGGVENWAYRMITREEGTTCESFKGMLKPEIQEGIEAMKELNKSARQDAERWWNQGLCVPEHIGRSLSPPDDDIKQEYKFSWEDEKEEEEDDPTV